MKKHIIGALVVLLLPAVCLAAGEAVVKTGKQSEKNPFLLETPRYVSGD